MAVPARRNGMDENEEGEGLFEEETLAWDDADGDVPPHLLALAEAAKIGDVDELRVALDNHIGSINDPIEDGDTVLHLCCLYGSLSCARLLVERGASLEAKDEEGAIPLHDACAGGYAEIVELLINSATTNSTLVKRMLTTADAEGDTPLHHAARGEHLNVVQFLLSIGASPTATNAYGKTPGELADSGTEVRRILEEAAGNPIDDCWRCSSADWRADRQRLADCGIGFGRDALGGKGGRIYVVTDSSDRDPVSPTPGTIRHAAIQDEPLWIVFSADMTIRLAEELLVNSFKTLDGRGANVHIAGGACITLQYVSNVIIHNLHIHDCVPAGNANVRSSPTHAGFRSRSDGDGVSIFGSHRIWIDHCSLSSCADGLIDAIMGSTGITISNNYFSRHNEVMLLGHSDSYRPDTGMQVTIAFNRFGEKLIQRMPRCRLGYFHIVNNDFTEWEMYAIGGSGSPTVNSQGNRYIAPPDPNAKEVTKRVDTEDTDWRGWNWRSDGDVMVNGAFFVPSGEGLEGIYSKASSVSPKSSGLIEQLTLNAGVLGGSRDNGEQNNGNGAGSAATDGSGGGVRGYLAMVFGSAGAPPPAPFCLLPAILLFYIHL